MSHTTEILFHGIEARIKQELDHAKFEVAMLQFQLTNLVLLNAIKAAVGRGVRVVAVLDSGMLPLCTPTSAIALCGAELWFDAKHAIAHNKLAVIDQKLVIGGSFNWSYNAEHRNAENAVFTRDAVIAKQCVSEISAHMLHSTKFAM